MKTSKENINSKEKVISMMLIITLIMQIVMPTLLPLKSYAESISTALGEISMQTDAKTLTEGEEIEIAITVVGNDIFAVNGYVDYDRDIFETVTNDNVTELPTGWNVISDGNIDADGVGFYIEMQNSKSTGVNNPV